MTIANGYVTLAEVRGVLYDASVTYTGADTRIEKSIEAASREIDRVCHRRFYGKAETRYYTAQDGYEITVDDLTGTPVIRTDYNGDGVYESQWTSSSYNLKYGDNYNADLDGKPFTQIELSYASTFYFPTGVKKGVQIYATFGYVSGTSANCPSQIHDACMITVVRLFKRPDVAPFGVQGGGNTTLGQTPIVIPRITLDPDVIDLISPFIRRVR